MKKLNLYNSLHQPGPEVGQHGAPRDIDRSGKKVRLQTKALHLCAKGPWRLSQKAIRHG